MPYHRLSSLGGSVISGIIAVFTSRYSQLRYTFLVPTSPQVCGLSFLASVQSIGPGSHPKAGTPSPWQKAQARLRHLCSFSSYGRSKVAEQGCADHPASAFFQHCLCYPPLSIDLKSPGTPHPHPDLSYEPSPIYPAGYLLWDVPQAHCTYQNQICHLSPNNPFPSSPSQFHCRPGHPCQTAGGHGRHIPHAHY